MQDDTAGVTDAWCERVREEVGYSLKAAGILLMTWHPVGDVDESVCKGKDAYRDAT